MAEANVWGDTTGGAKVGQMHKVGKRIELPITEDVVVWCTCRILCSAGLLRGMGLVKVTRSYLVFEHSSFLGRSGALLLSNLTLNDAASTSTSVFHSGESGAGIAGVLGDNELVCQKLVLELSRCVVVRQMPEVVASRLVLELRDTDAQKCQFAASLRRRLATQVCCKMLCPSHCVSENCASGLLSEMRVLMWCECGMSRMARVRAQVALTTAAANLLRHETLPHSTATSSRDTATESECLSPFLSLSLSLSRFVSVCE